MATFPLFRSKRTRVLLAALLLPLAGAFPASAAVLFGVDLTGAAGDEASQTFNNPSPQFISVTLSRVGLEAAPLTNGFGALGLPLGFTLDTTKYFEITLIPAPFVSYDITSISFRFALFADGWDLRLASSIDGFASQVPLTAGFELFDTGVHTFAAPIPGVVEQTVPTTFRLYAQGSSGFNPQSSGFVSASPAIEFSGSAVPEPTSAVLVAGTLAMMTFRRRR